MTSILFQTTGIDLVTKSISIPNTLDSVEFFMYDMAGKSVYEELILDHVSDTLQAGSIYL